jgi:hypothetical protein
VSAGRGRNTYANFSFKYSEKQIQASFLQLQRK